MRYPIPNDGRELTDREQSFIHNALFCYAEAQDEIANEHANPESLRRFAKDTATAVRKLADDLQEQDSFYIYVDTTRGL